MVTPNDLSLPRSRRSATARDVEKTCWFNCSICFCSWCCYLSTIFVINLLVVTIFFNAARGIPWDTEAPRAEIDSIAVTNFNLSRPMYGHWKINVTMHNKYSSFEFSDTSVSVFHESKEEALWMTSLEKFDMRPEDSTVRLKLDFWGSSADVDNATVRAIREEIINNFGAVRFNVRFKADKLRIRNVNPLRKVWFQTKVITVGMRCDLVLLFESSDQTRAHMLKTDDSQACHSDLVTYIMA